MTTDPSRRSAVNRTPSISSRNTRDDSLELDMNIKEALEKLKTGTPKRQNSRNSLSRQRLVLNSPEENPNSRVRSDVSKKILNDHFELKEFIEIEKKIQNDVVKVTVNLGKKPIAGKHS